MPRDSRRSSSAKAAQFYRYLDARFSQPSVQLLYKPSGNSGTSQPLRKPTAARARSVHRSSIRPPRKPVLCTYRQFMRRANPFCGPVVVLLRYSGAKRRPDHKTLMGSVAGCYCLDPGCALSAATRSVAWLGGQRTVVTSSTTAHPRPAPPRATITQIRAAIACNAIR